MAEHKHQGHGAREALARLIDLLRLERQGVYVVLVYAVGVGVASLAAPVGVQMLVSAIAFGGLAQPIAILSLLVLVALAFSAVLRAAQSWVVERIQQRLFVRVATDLAHRLPRIEYRALDAYHGPELVNRFFDVLTLQKGAAMLLVDGILVTLQVFVGGILLALYHPVLLAFAGVILVIIIAILWGLGRGGSTTSIYESKAKYALVGWFEEVARHPTVFRCDDGDEFAAARSTELIRDYVEYRQKHYRVVFRQTVAFLALEAFATAALLALGGVLVLRGQLTLGQLVAAELILSAVVAGFAKFGKYLETTYDLVAAVDKLGTLVELPLERDDGDPLPLSSRPLGVRLVDVKCMHGPVGVERVSLDIPPGARAAIVGPNGSGKSTLIDLVFALREPERGHVEVDGLPLRELDRATLRSQVALVRGASIFEGTVLENISLGRKGVSLDDVRESLEAVGMWEEVTKMPKGLSTRLTTNGENLSTGQAQRLAIARALVAKPRCLLFDEALDHLDPSARATVLEHILGPKAPWTVLVATHDESVALLCTHRFVICQGVVVSTEPEARAS